MMREHGIRLRIVGDLTALPRRVVAALRTAETSTNDGRQLDLIVALNYSGQWELTRACNKLLAMHDEDPLASVTSSDVTQLMALPDVPPPDLLIRTGGERRISNFYLWQLAYTELYFSDVLWPDVTEADFAGAWAEYARRDRRFGAAPNPHPQARAVGQI